MKFSQYATLFIGALATAIAADDNANSKGVRGLSPQKCKTYSADGPLLLKNSGVFRSARIDQLSGEQQCVNIAGFAGGALGASFCSGDTFSIAATPFFDEDGNEMGYYTRSGMRVPTFAGENPILVGNAFNALVFKNGDQLHFQGCDQAGAPNLVTAIASGTGEYVGAIGEVEIIDFLKPTGTTFEVCIVKN